MTDRENRVLKFRPRTYERPPSAHASGHASGMLAPDLSRYERGGETHTEYRHRMIMNAAAIAFTAALTGIGIWLAVTLADLRGKQDCVLMGRRDCAQISAHKTDLIRPN